MDAFIASKVVDALIRRNRERFDDGDAYYSLQPGATASPSPFSVPPATQPRGWDWFSFVLSALISATAAYLSWSCNAAMRYGTAERVLYAAGAAFFGVLYIVYYTLFRSDTCRLYGRH